MSLKILEHCCFRKYLNQWWEENEKRIKAYTRFIAVDGGQVGPMPEDSWQLIQYGDHTLIELLDWCINMAYTPTAAATSQSSDPVPDGSPSGVTVTIALPVLTDATLQYLAKHRFIGSLNLITRDPVTLPLNGVGGSSITAVTVPDLHTQLATVRGSDSPLEGRDGAFVLQGNLLQSVCPGKYITTLGITDRYYKSIQPLLDSWLRLYSKKS